MGAGSVDGEGRKDAPIPGEIHGLTRGEIGAGAVPAVAAVRRSRHAGEDLVARERALSDRVGVDADVAVRCIEHERRERAASEREAEGLRAFVVNMKNEV